MPLATEKELLHKADLAISDLSSNDGILLPDVADQFYRKLMDETSLIGEVRTVLMNKPKQKFPAIAFGSRLLRKARNNHTGAARADRKLTENERYKPTFSTLELDTNEVIGQIDIPYEVLEDNIEGGTIDAPKFRQTVLDMMAQRSRLDLEELTVKADTATVGDDFLAMDNGMLKMATSNVVNHNAAINAELFADMFDALPDRYHRLSNTMRFYVSRSREISYRMAVAQRQTQLGDSILTGNAPVSVLGIPLRGVSAMPNDKAMLLDPRNILLGIWRNIRIETDRDIEERMIKIVMTMRVGLQTEEEEMLVKGTNITD